MFNEIRGHTRHSLLICHFITTPAVHKFWLDWQVGELDRSILSQATERRLQFAFSLELCTYNWQQHHIIH